MNKPKIQFSRYSAITKSLSFFCMIAVLMLPALPTQAVEDKVGTTGEIKQVPGYPTGTKLKYRVSAVKTGPNSAHVWFDLKNPNSFDLDLVLCAMVSLKNKGHDVASPTFHVVKNSANEWECKDAGYNTKTPPNYHFSCRRVKVPANGQLNAIDWPCATCDPLFKPTPPLTFSVSFDAADLGAIYFDVLRDCPLKNCSQVVGQNQFLIPLEPPGPDPPYTLVWAGRTRFYEDLTSGGLSSSDWPSGNWVTMGFPGRFPARLIGTVRGARGGSVIQFIFNGVPGGRYIVPPPGTGGQDVRIDERFVIPDTDALDRITLRLPPGAIVNEGEVVRFNGEVLAEPGARFYQPGQFMYSVDVVFVKDTRLPLIRSLEVRQASPSSLRVAVEGTDETTLAAGATFVYSMGGRPEIEVPIGFAPTPSAGDSMFFSEEISGLLSGVPISYAVVVYDEMGNRTISQRNTIVLTGGFDVCIQDDRSGDTLFFNSFTGVYQYTRCSDRFTLTGRGTVSRLGCLLKLEDPYRVSASLVNCPFGSQNRGSATIKLTPLGPTCFIQDSNSINKTCACF